ncbi:MAG: hypothetical protein AAGF07_03145 [Patescibacteria group bacterium]
MIQSQIILTQTFVDEVALSNIIAANFIASNPILRIPDDYQSEVLKQIWEVGKANRQIIEVDIKGKENFKDLILSYYVTYSQPTILFMGNLSNYSIPLQEGMLRLLEEPPKNLFIVLYVKSKSEILPTIASRSRIYNLPRHFILTTLDQEMVQKVKKKLPATGEFCKSLLRNQKVGLPDLSKVERVELDFWYWQLCSYLEQYYLVKPSLDLANYLYKVMTAQKLNRDNVQKKFSFAWLQSI